MAITFGVIFLAIAGPCSGRCSASSSTFHRPMSPTRRASALSGATAVTFPTSDGLTLNGWFVSRTAAPRFAVLVFNGNAGNRAHRASFADALARDSRWPSSCSTIAAMEGTRDRPPKTDSGSMRGPHDSYLLTRPDVDSKPSRLLRRVSRNGRCRRAGRRNIRRRR